MTDQNPAASNTSIAQLVPGGASTTTSSSPKPTPPPPEKQAPWGKPENFDADKAWELIENLRKEKDGTPAVTDALRTQLEQMRADQTRQRDALAAALGVKPEETSDADKLAAQIEALRGQILASEKRALAVEFKVPEVMLTATDAEALRAQATSLVEFAQAAHYAATTNVPAAPPPAFQANPGQGQGSGPLSQEAQEAAEYEKYYPTKK